MVFRMLDAAAVKLRARNLKRGLIRALWGFGPADVTRACRDLGVKPGDIAMVHSGVVAASAYTGTIPQLVDAFIEAVGPNGGIAMQTMPYFGMRSADYLDSSKPFDVRRSVSMMGMISEVFRRRPDVGRSLHPTHPTAYWGSRGHWLVEKQLAELAPFGPDSPFGRLLKAKGKVIMFSAGVETMTFVCHLEHLFQDTLPVPLYEPDPKTGVVIDYDGHQHRIETLVLSRESSRTRNIARLESVLLRSGSLRSQRIGRTRLLVGDACAMHDAVASLISRGGDFHDSA